MNKFVRWCMTRLPGELDNLGTVIERTWTVTRKKGTDPDINFYHWCSKNKLYKTAEDFAELFLQFWSVKKRKDPEMDWHHVVGFKAPRAMLEEEWATRKGTK